MEIWGTIVIIVFFAIIAGKIAEKMKGTPMSKWIKDFFTNTKEKVDEFGENSVSKIYVKQGLKM